MTWLDYRELIIVAPCYFFALVLAFVIIPSLTAQETSKDQYYSLAIGDDSTVYKVGEGELTFTLENNRGQTLPSIYIYGLTLPNNVNQADVFLSNLYSQDGRPVSRISAQPDTITRSDISMPPAKIGISIPSNKEMGDFQGWLMLSLGEELISIPLKASTDPLFLIAVLWVSVGALVTIGTWELGRFFDRRQTKEELNSLTKELSVAAQVNDPKFLAIQNKKTRYDLRLTNSRQAIKFAFVDTFSFVFGIGLFYIGLLDNSFVTGLQTISEFDIYSLIGIGIGIGSLAGFINK